MNKKIRKKSEKVSSDLWKVLQNEVIKAVERENDNKSEVCRKCDLNTTAINKFLKGQGGKKTQLLTVFKLIYGLEIPIEKIISIINSDKYRGSIIFKKMEPGDINLLFKCSDKDLQTITDMIHVLLPKEILKKNRTAVK